MYGVYSSATADGVILLTRYLRHPAYFGWFYWSIATQLVLCNPMSAIAFAGWAWYFFSTR